VNPIAALKTILSQHIAACPTCDAGMDAADTGIEGYYALCNAGKAVIRRMLPAARAEHLRRAAGPDREANRQAAAHWCGWIADNFKVAISADWIVLSGVWDESKRELGLAADIEMVSRADEVWQVGPVVSPGMKMEADHARSLFKVVRDFTGIALDGKALEKFGEVIMRDWVRDAFRRGR
jgi:hypothetical protein